MPICSGYPIRVCCVNGAICSGKLHTYGIRRNSTKIYANSGIIEILTQSLLPTVDASTVVFFVRRIQFGFCLLVNCVKAFDSCRKCNINGFYTVFIITSIGNT